MAELFRFEDFTLDADDRRLTRAGAPVELNARYFDALALLVREAGTLVSKERFLDDVWKGVPVTDEALTQCIRTLRRQLGDDAARPRFIETVPKHGYRFVAVVSRDDVSPAPVPQSATAPAPRPTGDWRDALLLGGAGTIGAGVAGMIGGLVYGFLGAARAQHPGTGGATVLLVLLCVSILLALLGGGGVAFGIAAARLRADDRGLWSIVGGAGGGLAIGAVVKLLGLDAFDLLLGQSPGDVTGAAEGALLGAGVGLGAWLARRPARLVGKIAVAAIAGAAAGVAIPLLGGRLMAGSLDLLARQFPGSRLRFDQIGRLFGEDGLGPAGLIATGALEGALFAGCIVGAFAIAERQIRAARG